MDCSSSSRTPTLRGIKTSEKQTEAEDNAAKQAWDDKLTLSQPRQPLEKNIEQQRRKRYRLINEHNRLTFPVKEREAYLKELHESLKATNLHPEDASSRIRQLKNSVDKMKVKISEATQIQSTYRHIREHLQQEIHGMYEVLDQKEHVVAIGQAEVDKATKQSQSAAAAADDTQDRLVHLKYEYMGIKTEIDIELCQLSAEEKELRKQMEMQQINPKELEIEEEDEKEEDDEEKEEEDEDSIPVTDHQCYDISGASQSDRKLVMDMEALRETLGCADVKELVHKVVSQRATSEELVTEVAQYEELIRLEAEYLAQLHYAKLMLSAQHAATRSDKLKEEKQTCLSQEVGCVQQLQAKLQQHQDLLDAVKQGVNNLYFRMSCVPVEVSGLPDASSTDTAGQLEDIRAVLPTILQRASEQKPEISGQEDQEKVYSLLEQLNSMESRNVKRPTTPIQTLQLSDDEDESSPSREEIKHCSLRLTESEQQKSSKRTRK